MVTVEGIGPPVSSTAALQADVPPWDLTGMKKKAGSGSLDNKCRLGSHWDLLRAACRYCPDLVCLEGRDITFMLMRRVERLSVLVKPQGWLSLSLVRA